MLGGIIIGAAVLLVGILLGFAAGAVAGYSAGRIRGREEYIAELNGYGDGGDDDDDDPPAAPTPPNAPSITARLHQN